MHKRKRTKPSIVYTFDYIGKPMGPSHYADDRRLPAFYWNAVARAVGSFLRPYGDLGEGRLDFYHRSVSKAVRTKSVKHWFHFDSNC